MRAEALESRGRRKRRALNHTRSLACEREVKHTSKVTTGLADHPAFPAQWF
jgi:hypothetical protein